MSDRPRAFKFMDGFSPEHKTAFENAAEHQSLRKGEWLFRRGEPSGDVYLLRTGSLEVLDTRSTPEVVLAVLGPGDSVGEMAFVDDSPRSADVRASGSAEVLRWGSDDMRSLLHRYPSFGAEFFETAARIASFRLRRLTESAVAGAVTRRGAPALAGLGRARETAAAIAERAKSSLVGVDSRLRQTPGDRLAATRLVATLDEVQQDITSALLEHGAREERAMLDDLLSRELHPYLVRSTLAERCIGRPPGSAGTADILAHVLTNRATGDGTMGEIIDRWLLDRPTFAALRSFHTPTVETLQRVLPTDRHRDILILNAASGHLIAQMVTALGQPPSILSVVDQSREFLALMQERVGDRGDVTVKTYQENHAQFALGKARNTYPAQDAVVVHGLLEYLPERLAVSLLIACRQLLRPARGVVLASAMAPSDDMGLLELLLDWPTVRRSEEALRNVFTAAGLHPSAPANVIAPGVMLMGNVASP